MSATKAAARQINTSLSVTTITSASSITTNADTTDLFIVSALDRTGTFYLPSGSPVDGQPLTMRVQDNGTTQNLRWDETAYRAIGTILPETTGGGLSYFSMRYNAIDSVWDVLTVAQT